MKINKDQMPSLHGNFVRLTRTSFKAGRGMPQACFAVSRAIAQKLASKELLCLHVEHKIERSAFHFVVLPVTIR
jgi:hypothetical protein